MSYLFPDRFATINSRRKGAADAPYSGESSTRTKRGREPSSESTVDGVAIKSEDTDGEHPGPAAGKINRHTSPYPLQPVTKRPKIEMASPRVVSAPPQQTMRRANNAQGNTTDRRKMCDLISFKDIIVRVHAKAGAHGLEAKDVTQLRNAIQDLRFAPCNRSVVDRSCLIPKGLNLLKECNYKGLGIPEDVILDVSSLLKKYFRGDYDTALLRGIDMIKRQTQNERGVRRSGTHYQLNKDYEFKVSPNCVGHNGLYVGDWWPLQICALRDGAHGEIEAGIHGREDLGGALSVVISGGGEYEDRDEGDTIFYCGTRGKPGEGKPSSATQLLLQSNGSRNPIRVLRSSKQKSSVYKPARGIRYDGLYQVVDYEILDEHYVMYRFTLKREQNQSHIRYIGGEFGPKGARPSMREIREMDDERGKLKDPTAW